MKRRLRIAVSVFFAVGAVALCVLWVRSYWYVDQIDAIPGNGARLITIMSGCGVVSVQEWYPKGSRWSGDAWTRDSMPVQESWTKHFRETSKFRLETSANGRGMKLPYWFVALLAGSAATAPWLKRRFSLRTLLIAITVIAVVLGLIVVGRV